MHDRSGELDPDAAELLAEAVAAFVSPTLHIASITSLPIGSGMSGAAVRRYELVLDGAQGGTQRVRLVTKAAHLLERRVLALLTAQGQPSVPFTHTLDLTTEGPALICQQDVGDRCRPTSLEPITDEALQREAEGLAAIHVANLGHAQDLAWLPRTEPAHFADEVLDRWWRPHWQRMLKDAHFVQAFRPSIAPVEAAAGRMMEEMSALLAEDDFLTLIHGDINPSNVLVHHDKPFYIDWQVARCSSLYLDLPHHFCTVQQAEHYRQSLAAQGHKINRDRFVERYRVAARCIGFRYMWWTLENWQADHRETAWVLHYIHLILGKV